MRISLPITGLAFALLSSSALAVLTLERTTSLSDSLGGSLNISTNGTVEIPGADITSQATLTNFHPHDNQDLVASGAITRTRTRSDEVAISTYNGNLSLIGTDSKGKSVNDTIALQNLQVVREGESPTFTGTIVLNGSTINAAQMPDDVKHLLHRVLRFFYFD
jgi:hypothetical protein